MIMNEELFLCGAATLQGQGFVRNIRKMDLWNEFMLCDELTHIFFPISESVLKHILIMNLHLLWFI